MPTMIGIMHQRRNIVRFLSFIPELRPRLLSIPNKSHTNYRRLANKSAKMPLSKPLNIPAWLEKNSHLLQPPINNYCVYDEHMTVMVVGGPNARNDYHINETPEWFYQYKGSMLLKVVDGEDFKDIWINEGDMFLLPPNTPHNPVRFADTVGIVIEQPRPESSLDKLRWYCTGCKKIVHEAAFHCTDLGTQIKDAVNSFKESEELRRCKHCGELATAAPPAKKEEM
ncbi:3-hydroxyanthranilic acid dioxygenase-domain-containing protein [Pyronema domesticum]|nr:3-hydroxyanthranilic acid dioxygenase-domain-containing protein [Pyronema domesticum]